MEEESKSKTEKIIVTLLWLILLCIFICAFYFFENLTYVVYNKQLNQVCTDYGYNKVTDSRFVYPREYSGDETYILIECDNKVINNRYKNKNFIKDNWFEIKWIGEEQCTKTDKWGDCISWHSNQTRIILH